eukprot:1828977-Prymnesium_polylepis.1
MGCGRLQRGGAPRAVGRANGASHLLAGRAVPAPAAVRRAGGNHRCGRGARAAADAVGAALGEPSLSRLCGHAARAGRRRVLRRVPVAVRVARRV